MRLTALAIASIVWVGMARQQSPQPPTVTFRSGIDVVQLDVSVLDHDHRPVRGLTAADFTVLEDGSPQRLVAFQAFDIPDRVIPTTEWMREVAPDVATNRVLHGRLVVVVIDDMGMNRDYWTTATAARVGDTILDQLGPDDLTAVVYTKVNNKAQNFTADRARIRAAMSDITRGPSIQINRYNVSCTPASGTARVLDQLLRVTAALQTEPQRRKTILFVSPGVEMRGGLPNKCEDGLRKDLLRDAQRGNINIYAIDPGRLLAGWRMPDMLPNFEARLEEGRRPWSKEEPEGTDQRSTNNAGSVRAMAPRVGLMTRATALDDLRDLAESTGGRAILNTKEDNPESKVPRIFEENSSYYLLGFQSGNSKVDGTFRKLEVNVNRPDVEVRTRSGYYASVAGTPKSSKKPAPVAPLDESVTGLLPMTETPLRLTVAPFAIAGKREAAVAIALRVQQPAPAPGATGPLLTMLAHAYDLDGTSQASKRQTLDLGRAPNDNGDVQYEVLGRLDLLPGRYEVRVGTETAGGQRASVYTYVDVPNFAKDDLSLSGLVLERTPTGPVASKDALAGLLPVVPTTAREFARTDHIAAFLRLYQGGRGSPSPVQIVARIVNDRNETVFQQTTALGTEHFDRNRSADYRLSVPLGQLAAGEYLLTIEAIRDRHREHRDARFTVR